MDPTAACECGAEEQAVDHLLLHTQMYRSFYGVHDLIVLRDETVKMLLNTYPEILCDLPVDYRNWLEKQRRKHFKGSVKFRTTYLLDSRKDNEIIFLF